MNRNPFPKERVYYVLFVNPDRIYDETVSVSILAESHMQAGRMMTHEAIRLSLPGIVQQTAVFIVDAESGETQVYPFHSQTVTKVA